MNNIIHKFAEKSWEANAKTLRSASLALVYSTAKYCSPLWYQSRNTRLVDTQLNKTMRIVSSTVRSTPINWLHVLSNIASSNYRRTARAKHEWAKGTDEHKNLAIYQDLNILPRLRLRSRQPIWRHEQLEKSFTINIMLLWNNNTGNYN